jgi:hypothetical protein
VFYRQKFDTFIRRYDDVGYITGKSDFGDRVVDASGAVFLTALSRKAQTLDELTAKIAQSFVGVDFAALKKDAAEFYAMLEEDGFIVSGEDEIIAEMKANRLSSVQVSLYSMKADIHDSITKLPGSFLKTRDAILRLIENDIPLQISCPTMKRNKNCYVDVLNWAREHRVRAVTDYIMMAKYDRTTDNLDNRLSLEEVGKVINDIMGNDQVYQEEMKTADFGKADSRDTGNDIVCGVCVSSICMVANGNVYPCAGWQDYVVDNVRETPLREIWEKSPEGIGVKSAFQNLPYRGLKLHPRAHRWNLLDQKHLDCLYSLFGYAGENHFPAILRPVLPRGRVSRPVLPGECRRTTPPPRKTQKPPRSLRGRLPESSRRRTPPPRLARSPARFPPRRLSG